MGNGLLVRARPDRKAPRGTRLDTTAQRDHTFYTVHGLRSQNDLWLLGIQEGVQPMMSCAGNTTTVWLNGSVYQRVNAVVLARDIDDAIHNARTRILQAAGMLCDACQDGLAVSEAPEAENGERWCYACLDERST